MATVLARDGDGLCDDAAGSFSAIVYTPAVQLYSM